MNPYPQRLAPRPPETWDENVRKTLEAGMPPEVVESFYGENALPLTAAVGNIIHNTRLARPFLSFNGLLLKGVTIEPRLRELVILRASCHSQCDYEWAQHVKLAGSWYGVTAEEIADIAVGPAAERWSPLEAAALQATDELMTAHHIRDDTWERLAADLDAAQLVELIFAVGTYSTLAMMLNSFGTPRDADLAGDDIPPLPDNPGKHG